MLKPKRDAGSAVLTVLEMRRSLAQRIRELAPNPGEHLTPIPGLSLYHRASPTPCFRASYEPGLSIFVQGRKRILLGGTEYLCDRSSFLLSSIDVPAQSQIIEASAKTPSSHVKSGCTISGVAARCSQKATSVRRVRRSGSRMSQRIANAKSQRTR